MSGHSKWSTIKHKKEKTDAKRGKMFTKIGRELVIAVREGGADPNTNGKLRDVIAKAKAANMPNDTVNRAIKKAAGEGNAANFEEITYEGYGDNGVAFIVEVLTDNRNRTASDVRHLFDKFGNGLGTSGCVAWMFDKKGQIILEADENNSEDDLMLKALDAGAEDFSGEEGLYEIITEVSSFSAVREALEEEGFTFLSAEITMIPQNTIEIDDEETQTRVEKLIDMLEDLDDVQNVYHNAEMTE